MKNVKASLAALGLLLGLLMLQPNKSMAQRQVKLPEQKLIEHDIIGDVGSGKIDPPPPPSLSSKDDIAPKVKFYPNPCSNKLVLETDGSFSQKVAVYNLIGQFVTDVTITAPITEVNTQHFKPGIYILKTANGSFRFTKA